MPLLEWAAKVCPRQSAVAWSINDPPAEGFEVVGGNSVINMGRFPLA
jgi:hypothetical protein